MKRMIGVGAVVAALAMTANTACADDPYISTAGNHGDTGEKHFIDTAWTVTPQTRFELDYALLEDWTTSWGSSFLFGGSGESPWFTAFVQSGYIGFHNGGGWKSIYVAGANSKDVRFTAILDNYASVARVVSGGVTNSSATTSAASFGNSTIKIASRVSGTSNFASIKIYGFRIYEAGRKMRDYSPLVKGGVAGFIDSETGEFLSGVALTASDNVPEVEDDPYLSTTGNSGNKGASLYVDTYCKVTAATRFELDYALLDDFSDTESWYLFGGGSETPWFTAFVSGSQDYPGVGFANGYNAAGTAANWSTQHLGTGGNAKNIRHTAIVDNANDWAGVMTAGLTNSYATMNHWTSYGNGTIKIASHVNLKNYAPLKIYGYRVYEGGQKVHDYTPLRKGGVLGFRDSVTGAFLSDMHTAALTASANVPEEPEDAYVATPSGNSAIYIDTEYRATSNTCFALDCALVDDFSGSASWYLFYGYGSNPFSGYINASSGFGTQVNSATWESGIVGIGQIKKGIRRTFVLDACNCRSYAMIGGVTESSKEIPASTEHNAAPISVKIAANFRGESNYVPMKVYGCKIFESGVLVRNFVPRYRNGVAGLEDTLTGLFVSYPSDKARTTSNSLSAGGDICVEADPYIEGAGLAGQYFATNYKAKKTTHVEIDFAQTVINDTTKSHYIFGSRGESAGLSFFAFAYTSGGYGYSCADGSANWGNLKVYNQTTARQTMILDSKNGVFAWCDEYGVTNNSWSVTTTRTKDADKGFVIFGTREGSNVPESYLMPMKLYSCRIFEGDGETLVRDYRPAVKNGVLGLQDILPGGEFIAPAGSANAFGCGGVFPVTVGQDERQLSAGHSATLTASAPGAASYSWLKNGEPIGGGENGTLTVNWRRGAPTDTYQAVAVYSIDGLTAKSEVSEPLTVESLPSGMIMTLR